ncbi:C39 family peptidase (plasmid) [Bacillus sp. N5-665]|uniref:C39 family peptidase n=1 Tax=Bacillus TaxID=1386 RepID=UPI001F533B52|nr:MULTISPECIES: C39 family peptidase [Bacillus]MDR4943190.1 C39 family peptidase [Bacillus wiedmannii]UNK31117.1 C39 family peptidase [Bacillus sp. N5-665]
MNSLRKTSYCVFALSIFNTGIGMSYSDSPIFTKIQPAVLQEEDTRLEVEYERDVSAEPEKVVETENVPIEQEKEIVRPLDVPLILQKPELMRGCEVTSLAMVLQFSGVQVDKMELASKIKHVPFQSNGLKGNMHKGFIGDMATFDKPGLGVYVEPILELGKLYVTEEKVKNLSHKEPQQIYEAIDQGLPVWVLTNALFKQLPDDQFYTWKTEAGEMKVTYQQHSVVVTDYDDQYVYINDPLKTEKHIAINRNDFEQAWIQMGRQAMAISM